MLEFRVNCKFWQAGTKPEMGRCLKGHCNGQPTIEWCNNSCPVDGFSAAIPSDLRRVIPGNAGIQDVPSIQWASLGPLLWTKFHAYPWNADLTSARQWIEVFGNGIPCGECRSHWKRWVEEHPPDLRNAESLFRWTIDAHNAVNRRLGKREWTLDEAICKWATRPLLKNHAHEGVASSESFFHPAMPAPVNCVHAQHAARQHHVHCALRLYGGTPHIAVCKECPHRVPIHSDLPPIAAQPGRDKPREISSDNRVSAPNPKKSTREPRSDVQRTLLRCRLSPGDIVTLTAAVRDLHRAHPGLFDTAVETSAHELWDNNPYVSAYDANAGEWRIVDMHYPLIQHSNQRPVHFIQGYTEYLSQQLGVPIPTTEFRGDIHLSTDETSWVNQVREQFSYNGRFWIVVAGGKYDYTAKWWPPAYYQEVVDLLLGKVQFVQCGQSDHWHPPLRGVFNLLGKTTTRQFVRLMYHAEGVLCPVTFAMHLAAAVPSKSGRLRPCVVVAGGREPSHWEAYPGHQFLHTIGCLPCCATGGCWRSRCQTVPDNDRKNVDALCERPVQIDNSLRVPQCMVMIKPRNVADAIERSLGFFGG